MNGALSQAWAAAQDLALALVSALPKIVAGFVVFVVFYVAAGFVRRGVRGVMERYGRSPNVSRLMGRLTRWAIIAVGFFVALSVISPTLDAGTLVQVLGISGVAIGFAFRDILQNFMAGILILLTEPFTIGDWIAVDDHEGTVEDIETRATAIRTFDGRRIVIPNGQLYTKAVTVNTAYERRRFQFDFGIGYDDDVELARRLLKEAMAETEGVLADPAPEVYVTELGDSSVTLRARWWIEPERSSIVGVLDQVVARGKRTLEANGVDIPFPIRDVRLTREAAPAMAQAGSGGAG